MWLYHRVMSPNDADGMANSVDPDQTAPLGAVWSGSALFAQAYLSENFGSLRYVLSMISSVFYAEVYMCQALNSLWSSVNALTHQRALTVTSGWNKR